MEAHKYDKSRIKNLLGIRINVDKYNTFKCLSKIILKKKITVGRHISKGVWANPNSVMLLKKCGFEFVERDNDKLCYDMICEDININFCFPPQVYYTNKILTLLKKDKYFKKKYCLDNVLINDEYVKIEKCIKNPFAAYNKGKRYDIGIYSVEDEKSMIIIEINENQHKSRQTEDFKRSDDLLGRENLEGIKIERIFNLKLNKYNKVSETILDDLCEDIVDELKKIDKIADRKKFTIQYLVDHELGDKEFCTLLYNAKEKNEYIKFCDIFNVVEPRIKDKYVKLIKGYFWDWHVSQIKKLQATESANVTKISDIFADEDSCSESEDEDKESIIEKIKNMAIKKNNLISFNFDGIVRFLQFLGMHEEYFKNINGYHYILEYTQKSSNCMMDAIRELYEIQYNFTNGKKIRNYGDY